MTEENRPTQRTATRIAEDVLLALFQPDSGSIAGEGTLYSVLAGGVLADLVRGSGAELVDAGMRGVLVRATGHRPADALLRPMWELVRDRDRGVQTVLAACGPTLRGPLLDRLVDRGHVRRERRRAFGLFPSTALLVGGTGHREEIIGDMRSVLVDGEEPSERVATVIALVSASGTLPYIDRSIPWSTTTATRAKAIERGDGSASAASAAVTRTMVAGIVSSVIVSSAATGR